MATVDRAYQEALDRLGAVGFDALTERERDLAALWHVEAGINNGGLWRYYAGAGGDLASWAPAALERVGATVKAALVREANARFGPEGPPVAQDARRAQMETFGADVRAAWDRIERRYVDDPADVDELVERRAEARGS